MRRSLIADLVSRAADNEPVTLGALSAASAIAATPAPQRDVQAFLNALVSGGGTPIEQLSPTDSRAGVAIHQAYGATKWVAEHGDEIGVNGSRLAVAGNSVGGNMATVGSLMAKQQGGPALRFQPLLWRLTDAKFRTQSYLASNRDPKDERNLAVTLTPQGRALCTRGEKVNQAFAKTRGMTTGESPSSGLACRR